MVRSQNVAIVQQRAGAAAQAHDAITRESASRRYRSIDDLIFCKADTFIGI
jgi:hypothetical protein